MNLLTLQQGKTATSKELEELLAGLVRDGMTVALGGAVLRRRPTALVGALAALPVRDLKIVTWVGSIDVDYLLASGKVTSVDSAYIGFGPLGLSKTARRLSVEQDVQFFDWSEVSFASALRALASGMPFGLARGIMKTDVAAGLGEDRARLISSPFDGELILATRLPEIDLALLHVGSVDGLGNTIRNDPREDDDLDLLFAAAAISTVVSTEEVVTSSDRTTLRDRVLIPRHLIQEVALSPGGAIPTSCDGHYSANLDSLRSYMADTANAIEPFALKKSWDACRSVEITLNCVV